MEGDRDRSRRTRSNLIDCTGIRLRAATRIFFVLVQEAGQLCKEHLGEQWTLAGEGEAARGEVATG